MTMHPSPIPPTILRYCQQHGWSDPFFERGIWYAFPPHAVLPLALPTQPRKVADTFINACLMVGVMLTIVLYLLQFRWPHTIALLAATFYYTAFLMAFSVRSILVTRIAFIATGLFTMAISMTDHLSADSFLRGFLSGTLAALLTAMAGRRFRYPQS